MTRLASAMSETPARGSSEAPARRSIRVMLVDDHSFFRYGLRELLGEYKLKVVAEASSGELAVELVAETSPDVVLMDLNMPGIGGIEATRRITAQSPRTRVVVLTMRDDDEGTLEAIMAGASGYLLKDVAPEQIPAAVRAAFAGETPLSPRVATALLDRLKAREREHASVDVAADLTARELEVLRLLARGGGNIEIARELYASPSTIKNHISSILGKLQLENRIQAAVYAAKQGLL
jgi:two-component system, NarL family, response regulator LiaR